MWDLRAYGESVALQDDEGRTLSYREMAQEGERLSAAADGRCLVFILCENSIAAIVGYTGFLNAGVVPLLLGAQLEQGLLVHLMELYRPRWIYLPREQMQRDPAWRATAEYGDYCLVRTVYETQYPLHEDLALLLTTSGSTGSPKLVRQSYENIRANMNSIAAYLELDASERPITTLPMYYTYGLSIIHSHLAVGARILLTGATLAQREFWTFFQEAEATSFGGVPYTYEILDKLRFTRRDLPSLRTMTQAGGKLSVELHQKYAEYAAERGKRFIVMYGQCEATARMAYLPAQMALAKRGAMGIAIPGGRFWLEDDQGQEISGADSVGELVYAGRNVTLGYAESGEDLCKGDERQGVLRTGDMARRDADGYYYIVGRRKRFLKIYGNRVNLDEMEQLLRGHLKQECACAGVDDHMDIYLTREEDADAARAYAAHVTGLNPAAFRSVWVASIPKNEAGKILYGELEAHGVA